jgi:hypothetical protein
VLIGLAVVGLVIGIVSLFRGHRHPDAGGPPAGPYGGGYGPPPGQYPGGGTGPPPAAPPPGRGPPLT